MGSPGGGVGGSSGGGNPGGAGGTGAGNNDGPGGGGGSDSGSAGGNQGSGGGGGGSASGSGGGSGANSGANSGGSTNSGGGSFGDTMSSVTDAAGDAFGGMAGGTATPSDVSEADREADRAAQNAARDSYANHANEFSGLGPSGGPLSGDDSRNSHRGFGPDSSVAGGIDQDANAGLTNGGLSAHANEFSGLGPSGSPAGLEHANEFSGLGPSGGPFSGDDSRNSQRGYGPAPDQPAPEQKSPTDVLGIAGYGAAAAQGSLDAYGNYVDLSGRQAAAGTLTKGPAGNLPAPGYANRTDLGRAITDAPTAQRALDTTPYGPNATSTQQLNNAARTAKNYSRLGTGIGLGLQPGVGAVMGYMNTPEDASWTEKVTNSLVGGLKEFDDAAVSYGAGAGATALSAPALGPASIGVGAISGVAAGEVYNDSWFDRSLDTLAEDYARPGIQGTLDFVDQGFDSVVDFFSGDDDESALAR